MGKSSLLIVLSFLAFPVLAQNNRYMVFFTDKEGSGYQITNPSAYLSERAIERRARYNIAVTTQDIPVVEAYVELVKQQGAVALYRSRWMNGLLIQCDAATAAGVESLPMVSSVELVAPGGRPTSGGRRRSGQRTASSEVTTTQNNQLGLTDMHASGFRGEGISIAVFDAGFEGVSTASVFAPLFTESRIVLTHDFVYDQPDVYQHDKHGTEVLSVIAGYVPDSYTGGAYEAMFQLYVTEHVPTEYRIEEYNWLFAAERADSAGVDIINSSLGYSTFDEPSPDYSTSDMDGETAVITRAAQWAISRGIVVVASAGNEGNNAWGIVTAPADGEDVIAVGSVNSVGTRSGSSSRGPTADSRIKPNVMAMGVGTAVIKPSGATGVNSGTSFAAPLVTSLVAGLLQKYPEKTPQELRLLLESSASQATMPDNLMGYGIANFTSAVNLAEWETQEDYFNVYPNPVRDTLIIRPRSPVEIPEARVEIASVQGQVLASQLVRFNWLLPNYHIDMSGLSAGVYVLRVWLGDKPFAFRLVKI
jgi:hypothetical protein